MTSVVSESIKVNPNSFRLEKGDGDGKTLFPDFPRQHYPCVLEALLSLFLMQTQQIDSPVTMLRRHLQHVKMVESTRLDSKSRQTCKLHNFLSLHDSLLQDLIALFSQCDVMSVILALGATPNTPKQSLKIEFPKSDISPRNSCGPENMGSSNCGNECLRKVTSVYFSKRFLSKFDVMSSQKIWVLAQVQNLSNSVPGFAAKCNFKENQKKGVWQTVGFESDASGFDGGDSIWLQWSTPFSGFKLA